MQMQSPDELRKKLAAAQLESKEEERFVPALANNECSGSVRFCFHTFPVRIHTECLILLSIYVRIGRFLVWLNSRLFFIILS